MILDSLESARPTLETWFDISRKGPLPVVSSAITANASFSNFITDAIELQTLGQGQRDLFWHEYVHTMMFLHLKNFMGHAGSIFHIPWMPAWFLEGLAEALSVSVGSERQAIIERKQALSGTWPTYNRLHSLYSASGFFEQGYASSGAFVSWLLKKGYAVDKNFLPVFLKKFYRYTLPDYYPISATPFTDFLPMDQALRDFFGKNGRQLYEDYKREATLYWETHRKHVFLEAKLSEKASNFSTVPKVKTFGDSVFTYLSTNNTELSEVELRFDTKKGHVVEQKPNGVNVAKEVFQYSLHGDTPVGVRTRPDFKNGLPIYQIVLLKNSESHYSVDSVLMERKGQIFNLSESGSKIFWRETVSEVSSICYINKFDIHSEAKSRLSSLVRCPLSETLPKSIDILGHKMSQEGEAYVSEKIWYAIHEQTLVGDRHEVWEWDIDIGSTQLSWDQNALPLEFTRTQEALWGLIAERTHRTLVKMDRTGVCLGVLPLDEDVLSLTSSRQNLILTFSQDKTYTVRKIDTNSLSLQKCRKSKAHISPLLLAGLSSNLDLQTALQSASLWKEDSQNIDISQRESLGSGAQKSVVSQDKKAEWHPRPVLALPWIGANDALGYQLGILSVPLMDHMQNESVYASMLYGLASHYPNTEITVVSTRFWPQLSLSLYRRQLWNGTFRLNDGTDEVTFSDEKGSRFAVHWTMYLPYWTTSLMTGLLAAKRDPYIGLETPGSKGTLVQPFASLAFTGHIQSWIWLLGMDATVAPSQWNKNFDFNSLGSRFELRRPLTWLNSNLGFQLEGGRTRGVASKTPFLKQAYFPIKTFIPGSGSTYTQNSFPLFGSGTLLQARLGDTKARAEINWRAPIIKDWDKLSWILYFYELRFSNFINYGGAWDQEEKPSRHMIFAHGYSVDMLFENKGVHFSLGIGAGQTVPGAGQVFFNGGFEMFF
jgi:hypothetical protein